MVVGQDIAEEAGPHVGEGGVLHEGAGIVAAEGILLVDQVRHILDGEDILEVDNALDIPAEDTAAPGARMGVSLQAEKIKNNIKTSPFS